MTLREPGPQINNTYHKPSFPLKGWIVYIIYIYEQFQAINFTMLNWPWNIFVFKDVLATIFACFDYYGFQL